MTKKRNYFLGAVLAGCLMGANANAQDGPLYFGVKAGLMDADFAGFDEAVNIGLTVGYDLMRDSNGALSVEGEYTTTLSDGDIAGGGDWDADTLAAYGVYRTAGDLYAKVKAGFLSQDIKRRGGSGGTITGGDDSDFSYGAGVGWRMNPRAGLEVEYTVASDELNFLSIGYVTRF